jgi:hypothetical protein
MVYWLAGFASNSNEPLDRRLRTFAAMLPARPHAMVNIPHTDRSVFVMNIMDVGTFRCRIVARFNGRTLLKPNDILLATVTALAEMTSGTVVAVKAGPDHLAQIVHHAGLPGRQSPVLDLGWLHGPSRTHSGELFQARTHEYLGGGIRRNFARRGRNRNSPQSSDLAAAWICSCRCCERNCRQCSGVTPRLVWGSDHRVQN